tara:strand:+ start:13809 stop:14567 length:759 start_codon:yes stop_codon:yes gene_type:complete
MLQTRVIPILLIKDGGLYKGIKFKKHKYVGDPINTVKIFNDKEVDELVIIDISVTKENKEINFKLIKQIASEAFIPLAYGGGIKTVDDARKIFALGIEKVILNSEALNNPNLIKELSTEFGAQSIVFSLDVKKDFFGTLRVYSNCGSKKTKGTPIEIATEMEQNGAGEIILNSIDREGTGSGYDLNTIEDLSSTLKVPLIALGGAGSFSHMVKGKKAGAHALAAGSYFVFQGPLRGVLITYLSKKEIKQLEL